MRAASSRPHLPAGLGGLDVRFPPLVPATLLDRPNRFLVRVRIGGTVTAAATADPGRLEGILRPGVSVRLAPAVGPGRRTGYDLVLACRGRVRVGLVPVLANRILTAALARGGVPGLRRAGVVDREVRLGASRIDLVLRHRGRLVLTEVKSVTLVNGGRGLFPDAPTARGTRHVEELTAARRRGHAAQVVFVAQRADVRSVSPHRDLDPAFARALDRAAAAGVVLRAYACRVTARGCRLERRIPVVL